MRMLHLRCRCARLRATTFASFMTAA